MIRTSSNLMEEEVRIMESRLRAHPGMLGKLCTDLLRVCQSFQIDAIDSRTLGSSPAHCAVDTSAALRAPSDAHVALEGSFIQ